MASINSLDIDKIRGTEGLDFLISKIDKLVTLPEIYYRLEAVIEMPTVTIEDISRLLATDPNLCARLLRMANSVFYSFPVRIETIERAINTIGLRQIRELVLVTSVIEVFKSVSVERVNMRLFWEHSVAVGVLSRAIAQYAGLPKPERFYIPGLLHDLGRLALYMQLPGLMGDMLALAKSKNQMLYTIEHEQLGYSHAEAGGGLLELWKVPQSIYEPVGFHHNPMHAEEYMPLACAVHIADVCVHRQKKGGSGEQFKPSINTEALQFLRMEEDELDEIWALAQDEIADVSRQFLNH